MRQDGGEGRKAAPFFEGIAILANGLCYPLSQMGVNENSSSPGNVFQSRRSAGGNVSRV